MIILDDIKINPSRDLVIKHLGCKEGTCAYAEAKKEYGSVFAEISNKADFKAFIKGGFYKGQRAFFCILTLGDNVSEYITSLFNKGDAFKALLANTIADEFLFEGDKLVSERIRTECARILCGIENRLCAPEDIPVSEQAVIVEEIGSDEITINSAYAITPAKSLAYILMLTDDRSVFKAQHDCSKCSNFDCPRRVNPQKGSFSAVSSHGYKSNSSSETILGIDIGTTTIAFEKITMGIKRSFTSVNPQRKFGADVLSRIEAAHTHKDVMQRLILDEISPYFEGIDRVCIAANTTMVHLLMGFDCTGMGKYPFKCHTTNSIYTTAKDMGLSSYEIPVFIMPAVSAFVGGDIISGMYLCDFHKSDKINLFVDLGTNGEMTLGNKDRILTASTSAGPAFEGGKIKCGSGSVSGAVCGYDMNTGIVRTIDNKPPVSICGTGIIEVVSELLGHNIMDKSGLLTDKYFKDGYTVRGRVRIMQEDIRELQMAKGAVRAGIEILIKKYGICYDDIDMVYLAGGFGYHLNSKKACNIGLLPKELESKITAVGNSSLGGCIKYLNEQNEDAVNKIKSVCREVQLAEEQNFNELFLKYMNF